MKSILIVYVLAAQSLFCCDRKPTLPFESTVTYKMLELDAKLNGNNTAEVALCKKLMETACKKITEKYSEEEISKADKTKAEDILAKIDSTFTEFDFLFYTNPKDLHYDILSKALKENFPREKGLIRTSYQRKYWENKMGTCRLIDCDQYCRIYMGIAQMIHLPLKAVHIPEHYYIRWYLQDGSYICWNANDATIHESDNTMERYYKVAEYNKSYTTNYFPKELSATEVLTNYTIVWADKIWNDHPVIDIYKARENYLEAIKSKYVSSSLYNNYVWLYIMNPKLDGLTGIVELHKYIDQSISLKNDVNYYDAKACLYALENKFDKAISTEKEGLLIKFDENEKREKAESHLKCFLKREICREIK